MPRPRFNKLTPEKREQMLEAAIKEFVANGYEAASLNHILEEAGVSKGAAYYYFDDKADLFVTAVDYYTQQMMSDVKIDFDQLTPENFWPTLTEVYRPLFTRLASQPWMLTAWKASARLTKEARSNPVLAETFDQARGWLVTFFKRGQEIGAVRKDLPDDLLFALFQSVDTAGDQWLIEHWEDFSAEELQAISLRVADAMRRLMTP